MKLSNFIGGLEILRPHFDGGDGYHIGAEHDQYFVYATDTPLSEDEVAKMRSMGWFQSECEDDSPYEPAEGWSAFT